MGLHFFFVYFFYKAAAERIAKEQQRSAQPMHIDVADAKDMLAKLKKRDAGKKGGHKLIKLKGRRRVRARLVQPVANSLCHGDVFILDTGKVLYQFNGDQSNRKKKKRKYIAIKYITIIFFPFPFI